MGIILFAYGLFSSPWPRTIGMVELFLGGGLIVLVGGTGVAFALGWRKNNAFEIPIYISIIFVYLAIAPLISGLINNWRMVDLIRDVIPLVYMFIPLFAGYLFSNSQTMWRERISILIGIVGVIFSVRFLINTQSTIDNLLYLPQAPEVLFGGVYWILRGLRGGSKKLSTWSYLVLGFICFAATLVFSQRAEVGLIILSVILMMLISKKISKRIIGISVVAILFILIILTASDFGPKLISFVGSQFDRLIEKTQQTGFNGKDIELLSVINIVYEKNLLFGLGWGSEYFSPILGGMVSFTHSWLTYMLLKGGLFALISILFYIVWLVKPAIRILVNSKFYDKEVFPSLLACGAVLIHGTFLQTNYKTLGFGFVLLVLSLIRFSKNKMSNT